MDMRSCALFAAYAQLIRKHFNIIIMRVKQKYTIKLSEQ